MSDLKNKAVKAPNLEAEAIMEALKSGHHASQVLGEVIKKVADLSCPKAFGHQGPNTYERCGECVACSARQALYVEVNLAGISGQIKEYRRDHLSECPKCKDHHSVRRREGFEGGGKNCINENCDYWEMMN